MTVKDYAKKLKVSVSTIYRRIKKGLINATKVGRRWKIQEKKMNNKPVRGPNQPSKNDSAYKHYNDAYDAGALLDPLPEEYIKVRDIVNDYRVHISSVLGGNIVNWRNPLSIQLGIHMKYGPNWEVYVSPADADVLRNYLSKK